MEVVEPSDESWWKRPYAGREPPAGAKPGRPWFAAGALGVWVDEHGWRWPVSALPEGCQVPSQPSGSEPIEPLVQELRKLERSYQPGGGED